MEAVKRYVINPVEAREASLDTRDTLAMAFERPADVEVIEGFTTFADDELARFIDERGLAMDLADIQFCRAYFAEEGRDPSITEIKMIDTYWSDHCRHTTFGTVLNEVEIADANVQAAFDRYLELRRELRARREAGVPHGYGHHRREVAEERGHSHRARRVRGDQRLHHQVQGGCRWRGAGLAVPVQERDPQPSH